MHLFMIILAALFAFHFLVLTKQGQSIMRFAENALLIIFSVAAVLIFLFVLFVLIYNFPTHFALFFGVPAAVAVCAIVGNHFGKSADRRSEAKKLSSQYQRLQR